MKVILSVIALFFVTFLAHPTPSESLKCHECSGNKLCGEKQTDDIVECAGKCVSYINENGNDTIIRRCCSDNCKIGNGYKAYFCSKDQCNGINSDQKLFRKRVIMKRTADEESPLLNCYDCSAHNPECGISQATVVQSCRACLVFKNVHDNNNVVRRCCTSGCGSPGTVGDYDGRTAYFCSSNLCNGIGAENALTNGSVATSSAASSTRMSTTVTTPATTVQKSFSCYECSSDGDQQCTATMSNCPMCMVYRSDSDPTKFDRRCCWWGCGAPNQVSEYSSKPTYFCNADKCNGPGSEALLGSFTTTSTSTAISAITTKASSTTQKTPSQCYDCSGPECGKEGSSTSSNCPSCMVYRSPEDQSKIVRRCCWWNCGTPNSVSMYDGRETYFCTDDKCNGYGVESILTPAVTTTRLTTIASSSVTRTPSVTTMATSATTATTQSPLSECYECSGPACGTEGSATSFNCPTCTVHRHPSDQTKIVRSCCWWKCGAPNSVSIYNGLETYFCSGDKCNGYGVESILSPAVTTTAASTMTTGSTITASITTSSALSTSAVTTMTSSSSSCMLNCQNGGTPETENGCFCYCLDYTNGRECENVDCAQPDVDSEICSSENQSLCEESENFAFECHHLCGKC